MLTPTQKKFYDFYNQCDNLEREEATKQASEKFKCSMDYAIDRYNQWRKRYKLQSPLPPQIKMLDTKKFKGKNGTYELNKGLLLKHAGAYLNFKSRSEWENFKREFDSMFDYAIDVLKVGL